MISLDSLISLDADCLLSINGMRALWADYFMYAFSGKVIWVPLYASLLYVLFRNLPWKVALAAVVTIALVILFADQVSASLIRPYIARLRPANLENPLSEYVQIVNGYRGGRYGFPSCHAANTFALACYVWFIFRQRKLTIFFLVWAVLTGYSRAYLGVHYPGDLLVGAMVGALGATLCCGLFHGLTNRYLSYTRPSSFVHVNFPIWVGMATMGIILIYSLISAFPWF